MNVTFFDTLFTLIVILSASVGAVRGLIREVFGKLAVVLAVLVAISFFGVLAVQLAAVIPNPIGASAVAFLLLFVVTFIVVKIVQLMLGAVFRGEILGSLNRTLGFFFGALEGLVLVALILLVSTVQPWFAELRETMYACFYWHLLGGFLGLSVSYVRGMVA